MDDETGVHVDLKLHLKEYSTLLEESIPWAKQCNTANCKIKYLDKDLKEDYQLQQIYQSNKKALKKNISNINTEHNSQNFHKNNVLIGIHSWETEKRKVGRWRKNFLRWQKFFILLSMIRERLRLNVLRNKSSYYTIICK